MATNRVSFDSPEREFVSCDVALRRMQEVGREAAGKLTRGFAFVAYPAAYRNAGVMTFIVNQNGVVYQKDLGPQTSDAAVAMKEYNPYDTWEPAD